MTQIDCFVFHDRRDDVEDCSWLMEGMTECLGHVVEDIAVVRETRLNQGGQNAYC